MFCRLRVWSDPVWLGQAWTGVKEEGAGSMGDGPDVHNIYASAKSNQAASFTPEWLVIVQTGTCSGMPWRKLCHVIDRSKFNYLCRSKSLTPQFDLLCLSAEVDFYWQGWLHCYTPCLHLNAYATTNALSHRSQSPAHMHLLRHSTVCWECFHHPQSVHFPNSRLSEGLLGKKWGLCAPCFFYYSVQYMAEIIKEDEQ